MNKSNILTRIKMKLGLMAFSSPLVDIDDSINFILDEITTPVYSIYFPYKQKVTFNLNDLELVEKSDMYHCYLLPEMKARKLLYIIDVNYDEHSVSCIGYYDGITPMPSVSMINSTMIANASKSVANMLLPKLTFEFESPRKLYLHGSYYTPKIITELGFAHDKSLASISDDQREEYFKLALLDVKENLYPTLKYYSEINTAIGNINLKIDNWENAESERAELIKEYDDLSLLESWKPVYYG